MPCQHLRSSPSPSPSPIHSTFVCAIATPLIYNGSQLSIACIYAPLWHFDLFRFEQFNICRARMGDAISWVAVNDCGEVSLDSHLPPLPRGWERCLDLQSGVMYMKEMQTQSDFIMNGGGHLKSRATRKRQRVLLADDEDEGNPALQLTLAIQTLDDAIQLNPSNQSSLSDADSCADNGRRASSSDKSMQAAQWLKEMTQASPNGSSASDNAGFSSSFSSPLSKLKQWGSQSDNVELKSKKPYHEKNLIRAAGCPHCFMYVLPSKHNPKCPRCKSSILVDLSPLTIHR